MTTGRALTRCRALARRAPWAASLCIAMAFGAADVRAERGVSTTSMGAAVDATSWVARMGAETLPRRPMEALLMLARREQPDLALAELTRLVALDLLLGDTAAREVGDATLFASRRVGFAPEVEVRRQWLATLQQVWPERLEHAWRAASPELPSSIDAPAWKALRTSEAEGGLRMDEGLAEGQRAAAARLVLLRHRGFGGLPAGGITLADIWPQQNVQGRRLLRMGEVEYARAQARQLLKERFVEQWLLKDSGWNAAELAFVRRVVEARQRKLAWQRWSGLTGDPHGDAPPRDALAASVAADEIAAYYRSHLDRFTRLEAVDGLRLRCDREGCGAGEQGEDLRHRAGVVPVTWRLGEPAPHADVDAWSMDLLRAWPAGAASPPIRHPDGGGWERVQVLSVRRGHHPVDSETVRHEARQALALEKLEAQWRRRQQDLLAQAALQWAPDVPPPAAAFEPGRPMSANEGHDHAH